MKTSLFAVAVLLSLFVNLPVYSQTIKNSLHVHGKETISGAEHPERISAALAYHMMLAHYANLIEGKTRGETIIHLQAIGLDHADREILIGVLHQYKAEHDRDTASLHLGEDYAPRRDAHALLTRSDLQAKLSADGFRILDAYVERFKAQITITK